MGLDKHPAGFGFVLCCVLLSASGVSAQIPSGSPPSSSQSPASSSASAGQAPPDQDPRLAGLTPRYRQQILAEVPGTKTYCKQNAMLFAIFDCDCFSRLVLNYRITHPNDTTTSHSVATLGQTQPSPFVNLLVGDKLDCSDCISDERITTWVTSSSHAGPSLIACISRTMSASLRAKPYVGEIQQLYNLAVTSCNK